MRQKKATKKTTSFKFDVDSETHGTLGDKVKAFGWTMRNEPGEFQWISKHKIRVDPKYQRDPHVVKSIVKDWDWAAFGAISVVPREDGWLYATDGGHRTTAAMERSDIDLLPCMVFKLDSIEEEAGAFRRANEARKNVTAIEKFKAGVVEKDPLYMKIKALLDELDLEVSDVSNSDNLSAIGTVVNLARRGNFETLREIMTKARFLAMAEEQMINVVLIQGLAWICRRGGFNNKRLMERLDAVGFTRLVTAARRRSAIIGKGGPEVWAAGMIEEANKGLRRRIVLKEGE